MLSVWRPAAARLALEQGGFTLIELLNVMLLMAVLVAISVPSYFSFQDRAYRIAATGNAKEAVLASQLYWDVNYPNSSRDPDAGTSTVDSGYAGMSWAGLKTVDAALAADVYVNNSGREAAGVTARAPLDATHFCVYAASGRWFAYELNTGTEIITTVDPTAVCT